MLSMKQHSLQQVEGASHVALHQSTGPINGAIHMDLWYEVHHKNNQGLPGEVCSEVEKMHNAVSQQTPDDCTTNEPRASNDQYPRTSLKQEFLHPHGSLARECVREDWSAQELRQLRQPLYLYSLYWCHSNVDILSIDNKKTSLCDSEALVGQRSLDPT